MSEQTEGGGLRLPYRRKDSYPMPSYAQPEPDPAIQTQQLRDAYDRATFSGHPEWTAEADKMLRAGEDEADIAEFLDELRFGSNPTTATEEFIDEEGGEDLPPDGTVEISERSLMRLNRPTLEQMVIDRDVPVPPDATKRVLVGLILADADR